MLGDHAGLQPIVTWGFVTPTFLPFPPAMWQDLKTGAGALPVPYLPTPRTWC